jgi:hypothetical protein
MAPPAIRLTALLSVLLLLAVTALADQQAALRITMPEALEVQSATATAARLRLDSPGQPAEQEIAFLNLLPDTPYDVRLALKDGRVLQGVAMNWPGLDAPDPEAAELTDEDRAEIQRLVADVPSFYDRSRILLLQGNRDRVVSLVELVRDRAFHDSRPGEVIWRVELWYFRFRHGGWERVSQQNRVLRRERFSREQFQQTTSQLRWLPELGGIVLTPGESRTIAVDLP